MTYASDTSLGVFDLSRPAEVEALAVAVGRIGGSHEVVLRKYRARRSDAQNRYWWGVVIPALAGCWGCDLQEAHDIVLVEFVGRAREVNGKAITLPGSTAALNTAQFNELIKAVQQHAAAEHGVYIPDPNEWPDE